MSFVGSNILAGASGSQGDAGYKIERSLRFNSADSAYLNRTPSSAGNRKTWTWSGWVKRSKLGTAMSVLTAGTNASTALDTIEFDNNDKLRIYSYNGSFTYNYVTAQVFRDPGAWFHLAVSLDTTNGTASDRLKVYINGSRITVFDTATDPGSGIDTNFFNTANAHYLGYQVSRYPGDFYLSDVHFIDGQALAPTDFGEYDSNNVWQPKEFTGSYASDPLYSSYATNPSSFNGSAHNLFNGDLTTAWQNTDTSGSTYASVDLTQGGAASGIAFTTSFEMYGVFNDNQVLEIDHAGGTHTYNGNPGGSGAWIDFASSLTSPVTAIRFKDSGGSGTPSWNAIRVDNTILTESGVNSFHLDFSDNSSNSALGDDSSGNNNDWTVNNIEAGAPGNVDASGFVVTSGPGTGPNNANLTFDGNTSTKNYAHGYGTHYVHIDTSSAPISCSSTDTLTIYWSTSTTNPRDADLVLEFSGGSTTAYTAFTRTSGTQNNTITIGTTGSITDIRFGETSASNPGELHLHAIKLNGTFLVTTQEPDSLLDTPTNYEASSGNNGGNYATLNPLASGGVTLSNGNLDASISTTDPRSAVSTIAASSGKWFAEVTCTSGSQMMVGVVTDQYSPISGTTRAHAVSSGGGSVAYHATTGNKRIDTSDSSYGATYGNGDVIGIALNLDDDEITFYKNGSSQGTITGKSFTGGYTFFVSNGGSTQTQGITVNFGQRPFAYTPPTGYLSLCTQNLTDPTIADGSLYFDTKLYTGNGGNNPQTGLGFSPDFVWLKNRSDATGWHQFRDIVRGGDKNLASNATNAETDASNKDLDFDSNGFTLTGTSGSTDDNKSGDAYVAWAWDAGTSNTSISAGGLNSSVYDQSVVWSSQGTATNWQASYPFTRIFNGNDYGSWDQAASGNSASWTHTIYNVSSFKIRLYVPNRTYHTAANDVKINGSDIVQAHVITPNLAEGWHTLDIGNIGTFTSLEVDDSYWYVQAIYINGKQLVDSNVTPPLNVPSIASTVRANPSAGFSIVEFTNPSSGDWTFGHGLNAAPEFFVMRPKGATSNWQTYHKGLTALGSGRKFLWLNSTNAEMGTNNTYWTSDPDSSVCYAGTGMQPGSQQVHIAYCFAPVEGYSAFGSYTGNGSADGPFVYTGFRPKWWSAALASNGTCLTELEIHTM
jgi:hypothetical protein